MKKIVSMVLFLAIYISVFAEVKTGDMSNVYKTLDNLKSNVEYTTLSNGIRVLLYKRGYAPVFAGSVSIGVGGVDEVPGNTGISHLFEHMAFKGTSKIGTKNYSKEKKILAKLEDIMLASNAGNDLSEEQKESVSKLQEELESVWDSESTIDKIYDKLGGVGLNATTSADMTRYFLSLPNNALEVWCKIESDKILDPVFRQFYKEREVVQEERRMRFEDSPNGALYAAQMAHSFKSHPYRRPVIGYEEDINNLTATQLKSFHNEYYVPSNIVISLVGNFDIDTAKNLLEKYFGRINKGEKPKRSNIVEKEQKGEVEFEIRKDAEPQFSIAYHKPNYPHPEDLALNIWLELAMGSKTSPLYKELVIDREILNDVGYFEGPGAAHPNLYILYGEPRKGYTNKQSILEIDKILARLLRTGFSKEELNIEKRKQVASYISNLKSNMGIARSLSDAEILYGGWQYSLSWISELEKLTPEVINKVANKYLLANNRTIGRLEKER